MTHSLEVYHNSKLIFSSDQHWLHPLFELEEFLTQNQYTAGNLLIKDKIIGRAAALLLVRLKVGEIIALTLSQPAEEVLQYYNIPYSCEKKIERVECATENILLNELDPEKAYQFIRSRIESKTTSPVEKS